MSITVVGIDSGFSYMKAVTSTKKILFPNIIADGDDRAFARTVGSSDNLLDNLDIRITSTSEPRHFFIGNLALHEGDRPIYIWDTDRVNTIHAKASLLTALALLADSDGHPFRVCTGLPVQDYVTELRRAYEQSLVGEHAVTFCSGPLEGITKKFKIKGIKVTAQGLGIFFNEIISNMCTVTNSPLTGGRVGVIDIGFRTTNILLLDNMLPQRNLSEGLEAGMSYAFEFVRGYLTKQGLPLELAKMEVEFWKDSLTFGNKQIDIKHAREKALQRLAGEIAQEIKRLWRRIPDLKAILVGGGGAPAVFTYLDIPNKQMVAEPQMANAKGFFKTVNLKNIYRPGSNK